MGSGQQLVACRKHLLRRGGSSTNKKAASWLRALLFCKKNRDKFRQDETLLCPLPLCQRETLRLSALSNVRIGPEAKIYTLAQTFQRKLIRSWRRTRREPTPHPSSSPSTARPAPAPESVCKGCARRRGAQRKDKNGLKGNSLRFLCVSAPLRQSGWRYNQTLGSSSVTVRWRQPTMTNRW